MPKPQAEQLISKIEKFAEDSLLEFPGLALSIEHDSRGKNRAMTLRVMPAVDKKTKVTKGNHVR